MWTVIYIAPTAKIAERIKQRLTEEGFLVQDTGYLIYPKINLKLSFPQVKLEEVQEVLNSILHR